MKTLLGRVKGCALDVIVGPQDPPGIVPLLSSHTKQFRSLSFTRNSSRDIQMFLEANPGPLPLLHTIEISSIWHYALQESVITPPAVPLFKNATDLKTFSFFSNSGWSPSLGYFAFPNLTSFYLSVEPDESFSVSQLLDFLEASPMLQIVNMVLVADIELEDVPQERVVVLHNVDSFNLTLVDSVSVYEFGAYISCPSASSASLAHTKDTYDVNEEEVFPPSDLWDTIVDRYTRSSLEEVAFEIIGTPATTCKLAFRSSDGSVLKFSFEVTTNNEHEEERKDERAHSKIFDKIFYQATRIIRDHPQANGVKRLRIHHSQDAYDHATDIADQVSQLFKSLGPLDELTLHRCSLSQYFSRAFHRYREDLGEKVVFTPIKQLTISHPYGSCFSDVISLAKSQHELGVPFERVTIRGRYRYEEAEKELRPWVDTVEYYCEGWEEEEKPIID